MCDLCWGGALEHYIMLKNGGEILPGVVTKCIRKYLTASTQHKTQHTTQKHKNTTTNSSYFIKAHTPQIRQNQIRPHANHLSDQTSPPIFGK